MHPCVASARPAGVSLASLPIHVVAAAAVACEPSHTQHEPAAEAAVPRVNQFADLETILKERDACGVSDNACLRCLDASPS
ncbi:glutamate synthetase [Haematococcus lacustris]|uniref:Glutamate synthetase n=1 Tax=Haematococcus lacustris TaxID=44745 RepID=A0A699YQ96_HAELA|nr:glutamate synthetase [Haematococcus lacustris]